MHRVTVTIQLDCESKPDDGDLTDICSDFHDQARREYLGKSIRVASVCAKAEDSYQILQAAPEGLS